MPRCGGGGRSRRPALPAAAGAHGRTDDDSQAQWGAARVGKRRWRQDAPILRTSQVTELTNPNDKEWFRDLAEFSSDWFWEQDAEFRFTGFWGEMHARTGADAPSAVGKCRWDLGIRGISEDQWRVHRQALARHEVFRDLVYSFLDGDGVTHWLAVSGKPVFGADGGFAGYRGIGRDVTAQVLAADALREREAELRLLMDSVPASIGHFDADLRLCFVNRAFERVFNRPAAELAGRHLREIVDQPTYAFIKPHFDRALQGITCSYRRTSQVPGGSPYVLDVTVVPQLDAAGQVIGCYGVAMDVTALERAGEEVRGLQQRFGSAMENTTDMMAVFRIDGEQLIIEQFNPALRDFYEHRFAGVRIADWIGRTLEEFLRTVGGLTRDKLAETLAPFKRALFTGRVVRYRSTIDSPAAPQQRDALLVPIADAAGRRTHLFYRGADISELVRKEEQLQQLNALLERRVSERTAELSAANRELEAFAYSVSHDLRTPLRGIDGFSQLLLEQHSAALGEQGIGYLQRVRRGTQRMGTLIDDMLMLSRVARAPLTRVNVDLSALAAEVAAELQRQSPARLVAWRLAPAIEIDADPGLIRILLDNLLGNAWKYTRDSAAPVIELGVESVAAGVAFFVRDNGVGFDMAYAGKLFQAFQRLHRPKDFEGTGIGLATAARVVQRHGGRISAEGRPGDGATFHVFLPDQEA